MKMRHIRKYIYIAEANNLATLNHECHLGDGTRLWVTHHTTYVPTVFQLFVPLSRQISNGTLTVPFAVF